MSDDSERDRLPFEPASKRKKPQKEQASSPAENASKSDKSASSSSKRSKQASEDMKIPEVVSRRMLRRMMIFSAIPVSLGIFVFFASYFIITQGIAELPNVVVLLTTIGCFGLSVVGLSYGALSASWEENAVGGIVGYDQFQLNFGRMVNSWQQAREERQNNS